MEFTYCKYVNPYLFDFTQVILPMDKIGKVGQLTRQIIAKKAIEQHHMVDNGQEFTRFFNGLLGELAIESILKKPVIDWGVGNSAQFNHADLSKLGINIGIKTVEWDKFPVIPKEPKYPEIIVLKKCATELYVCGVASIEVLQAYQNDNLILSPKLRSRGVKTGFYGFEKLKQFHSLEQLKQLQ